MPGLSTPRLFVDEPREPARGVALVLHGGRSVSRAPVRPAQLAVLRMRVIAAALRRANAPLAVARLLFQVRGWNGMERSPLADAAWALDKLAARFPGTPVALVGHSMGARTAIHVAGHDAVRVVVGLAPWIEAGDPIAPLAGRRVLIAHGDLDRMTSPEASRRYAQEAARVAETVSYVKVAGDAHAMLRRPNVWTDLTVGFVLGTLLDAAPNGNRIATVATRAVAGALAGRRTIDV